jgi:hypothetical protein
MADLGGATRDERIAYLELQLSQQETNIRANIYRQHQIQSEMTRLDDSIEASKKEIELLKEQLAAETDDGG